MEAIKLTIPIPITAISERSKCSKRAIHNALNGCDTKITTAKAISKAMYEKEFGMTYKEFFYALFFTKGKTPREIYRNIKMKEMLELEEVGV